MTPTPKEKAEQLVESFMNIKQQKLTDYSRIYHSTAKQCALIAVDEMLKEIDVFFLERYNATDRFYYWQEIKNEIEKL